MNKFGRFLFRISAETCLIMDYFASKFPNLPTAGGSTPDPSLNSMARECANSKDPTTIEHF